MASYEKSDITCRIYLIGKWHRGYRNLEALPVGIVQGIEIFGLGIFVGESDVCKIFVRRVQKLENEK